MKIPVDLKNIIGFGISYGGGMLLKASLKEEFQKHPLKSIYLYYCFKTDCENEGCVIQT